MSELAVIRNVRAFLRAVGCCSLRELEDLLDERLEPAHVQIRGIGRFASEGVEIQVQDRGTALDFPFAPLKFWAAVDLLELEADSASAYEELASQVLDVEGIDISVRVSYDVDDTRVKPSHRRTVLDNEVVVQFPRAYPYRSPMNGVRTFAEWRTTRFDRHYPGLEPRLLPPHDKAPDTTSLAMLRG